MIDLTLTYVIIALTRVHRRSWSVRNCGLNHCGKAHLSVEAAGHKHFIVNTHEETFIFMMSVRMGLPFRYRMARASWAKLSFHLWFMTIIYELVPTNSNKGLSRTTFMITVLKTKNKVLKTESRVFKMENKKDWCGESPRVPGADCWIPVGVEGWF